jgi:hypothetical protein
MSEKINLTLDRPLWDALTKFAHKQSLLKGKRFTVIEGLHSNPGVLKATRQGSK